MLEDLMLTIFFFFFPARSIARQVKIAIMYGIKTLNARLFMFSKTELHSVKKLAVIDRRSLYQTEEVGTKMKDGE